MLYLNQNNKRLKGKEGIKFQEPLSFAMLKCDIHQSSSLHSRIFHSVFSKEKRFQLWGEQARANHPCFNFCKDSDPHSVVMFYLMALTSINSPWIIWGVSYKLCYSKHSPFQVITSRKILTLTVKWLMRMWTGRSRSRVWETSTQSLWQTVSQLARFNCWVLHRPFWALLQKWCSWMNLPHRLMVQLRTKCLRICLPISSRAPF